jgi:hypothetical protein
MDVQPGELLEREHPAAERDTAAGDAGAGPGDGNGDSGARGLAQGGRDFGLVRRRQDALGVAFEAGGVLQVDGSYVAP